jgi:beta-lactamase regulating signal transducer with metallopeptidase domain
MGGVETLSIQPLGPFLWWSTILLVTALILNSTLLRRSPALRHGVWVAALLFLPLLWLSAGLRWDLWDWVESRQSTGQPAMEVSSPVSFLAELPAVSEQWSRPGEWLGHRLAPPTEKRNSGLSGTTLCEFAWIGGVLIAAAGFWRRRRKLAARLVRARPVEADSFAARFARLVAQLRMPRRLRLLAEEGSTSPAAARVLWPVVLVPLADTERWRPGLESSLAHEILHHRRRDLLVDQLVAVVRALFWFHPLVHLAVRAMRVERERAVDLAVVRELGDAQIYAEELGALARRLAGECSPALPLTLSFGHRTSALRRRIEMVLSHQRYHVPAHPMLAAATTTAGLGLVTLFLMLGACGTSGDSREEARTIDEDAQMVRVVGPDGVEYSESMSTRGGAMTGVIALPRDPTRWEIEGLDRTRVGPTDQPAVYRTKERFSEVSEVYLVPRPKKPYTDERGIADFTPEAGWLFDRSTGLLKLASAVDPKENRVLVYGTRAIPWSWSFEKLDFDSVRLLLRGEEAERGVDYVVDAASGTVSFVRAEDCTDEIPFYLTGRGQLDDLRDRPGLSSSVAFAIGQLEDRSTIRRFEGLPVDLPGEEGLAVKLDAVATWRMDDSRVRVPTRPAQSRGLQVSIANSGGHHRSWLERGSDFTFDEATQRIVLLGDRGSEEEGSHMMVWSLPPKSDAWQFPGPIGRGEARMVINGIELEEGVHFTVDYDRNTVILVETPEEALGEPGGPWEFGVAVGDRVMGFVPDEE